MGFFALATALALLFIFIAYDLSDPNWHPTGRRRNSILVYLLTLLPWWLRITIFAGLAAVMFLLFLMLLFRAFDRKPDFTIGPDGISRNFILGVRTIAWPDVQSVILRGDTIKIVGSPRSGYKTNTEIEYDPVFFRKAKDEVLGLIRTYRPDLLIEVQNQASQ